MPTQEQMLEMKLEALREAVETYADSDLMHRQVGESAEVTYAKGTAAVVATAKRYLGFLSGVSKFTMYRGPVVAKQSDVHEPKTLVTEGDTVQINTGQKFSVAIDTKDAAGYPTDATVEWEIADATIATVTHDDADDQKGWVVSGSPGSTVLTVRVTDVDPPLEATLAVDVVPAGTATVAIATGPAVPEEDPQPEPLTLTVTEDTTDTTRMTCSIVCDNKGEGPVTILVGHDGISLTNPGDGTTVTTHQYPAANTYTVTASDDDNATRFATSDVTVPYTV